MPINESYFTDGDIRATYSLEDISIELFLSEYQSQGDRKLYYIKESNHTDYVIDTLGNIKDYFHKTSIRGNLMTRYHLALMI